MNFLEFTKRFPTENDAIDFIVATKYKGGYVCPNCGCVHKGIYHQNYDRRKLYCNNCKCEFSALVGTTRLFHLPLKYSEQFPYPH
ncbi:MAG: transposase, partial [Paludibacteraceae bacterium]|nr:transposase [Paludibacteraceae bacterium]